MKSLRFLGIQYRNAQDEEQADEGFVAHRQNFYGNVNLIIYRKRRRAGVR